MAREYVNGEPVLLPEDDLRIGDTVRYVRGGKLNWESRAWGDEEELRIGQEYYVQDTLYEAIKVGGPGEVGRRFIERSHFTVVSLASRTGQQPVTLANALNLTQLTCPHCQKQVSVAVEQGSNLRVVPPPGSVSHRDWEGITLADLRKLPRLPAGQQYAIVKKDPANPEEWPHFVSEMQDMMSKVIVVSKKQHNRDYGDYYLGELPDSGREEKNWFWWRPEWLVLLGDIESWYEFEVPDEPRRVRRIQLRNDNNNVKPENA